jgi:hypothetical protein
MPPATSGGQGDRRLSGASTAGGESGKRNGPRGARFDDTCVALLDYLDVIGLKTLVALDDLELDLLTLDERAIAVHRVIFE